MPEHTGKCFSQAKHDWKMKINHIILSYCKQEIVKRRSKLSHGIIYLFAKTFFCCLLSRPEDLHRIRVEHMERQLANLTGLVQKALVQNPATNSAPVPQQYLGVGGGQYRNG